MITNSSSSAYFNIDESEEDSNEDEELSLLAHEYNDSHRCTPLVSSQNISTTSNIHRDQKVSKGF